MPDIRHPEKVKNKDSAVMPKPKWIRSRIPSSDTFKSTKEIIKKGNVVTVCEEANCPNLGECWSKKHATFMIMGDTCTRACAFCNVKTGKPEALDQFEPYRVSQTVKNLELDHVVITSVDRDDLGDGGALHFSKTIDLIRQATPSTTIEVLTPDFLRKNGSLEIVLNSRPDVFNHNLETVPRLYLSIRPGARYFNSLKILSDAKDIMPEVFTKSGLMLGLGETKDEIMQVMDDLRSANVDFLTLGQYLQPSKDHLKVERFVHPDEFDMLRVYGEKLGFRHVASGPLVRSSYHADKQAQGEKV